MPWMSYAEISEAFGINGNSARALVRRKKWARQLGNDGATRVSIPDEALSERAASTPADPPVVTPVDTPSRAPDGTPAIEALARTISRLEDDLRLARELADSVPVLRSSLAAVEVARDAAVARAASAEADAAAAKARTDALVAKLADLSARMLEVEQNRISREARPWWRRIVG
jgi:hypothetical protein